MLPTIGPPQRRFHTLRAGEVGTRCSERSILVQPIGAIEQHGPHLPLATDLIIAEAAAYAAVDRYGDALDLWVLPPLPYSKSNEHAWAPGTIWLSATTLLAVLDDLGRAVAATPIRRLVFVNGHGGNSALLDVACRELRLQHGLYTFLVHPTLPPDHGGAGDAREEGLGIHGGLAETSLLLHLCPDLVEMSVAARNVPAWLTANHYVRFGGPARFGWLADDFGPSGVIGDPLGATVGQGEALFASMVAALGQTLNEVSGFSFPPTDIGEERHASDA